MIKTGVGSSVPWGEGCVAGRARGRGRRMGAVAVAMTVLGASACAADNPAYLGANRVDAAPSDGGVPSPGDRADGGTSATGAPASADPARFGFEVDTQGWADVRGDKSTPVRRSTARAYRGAASLEISLATTSASDYQYIGVSWATDQQGSPPSAGSTVTLHVWIPPSGVFGVQPFILYQPAGAAAAIWAGVLTTTTNLTRGQWNTFTQKIPADAQRVVELGVEWRTETAWRGTVYVDSVDW